MELGKDAVLNGLHSAWQQAKLVELAGLDANGKGVLVEIMACGVRDGGVNERFLAFLRSSLDGQRRRWRLACDR